MDLMAPKSNEIALMPQNNEPVMETPQENNAPFMHPRTNSITNLPKTQSSAISNTRQYLYALAHPMLHRMDTLGLAQLASPNSGYHYKPKDSIPIPNTIFIASNEGDSHHHYSMPTSKPMASKANNDLTPEESIFTPIHSGVKKLRKIRISADVSEVQQADFFLQNEVMTNPAHSSRNQYLIRPWDHNSIK